MENMAPLKQGLLKRPLEPVTPPSRNLSEQRCADLLLHLQTPLPKPRCCPGELPPHHDPRARDKGTVPGSPRWSSPETPTPGCEVGRPPGKQAGGHGPSCPCFAGNRKLFGQQQPRSRWLRRSLAGAVRATKSRRLLPGVTGEADARCPSLGGARGNAASREGRQPRGAPWLFCWAAGPWGVC